MRIGYTLRRGILDVAAPRARTLNVAMTAQNIIAANGPAATWGIDTTLTARATRGLYETPTDNDPDLDLHGTGGLLS